MRFQTMVLKFIKEEYDDETFEKDCMADVDKLCNEYNLEITNNTYYERTRCLSITLKAKKNLRVPVIK